MQPWVTLLVIVVAVASRPLEVRLWRAGRLSDRTVTLLLLGRFPLVVALFAVLSGGSLPMTLVLVAISVLPGLFLYRFVLTLTHDQVSR
jgi:hypothetical protein